MQVAEILANKDYLNEDFTKLSTAQPCLKLLMETKKKVPAGTVLQLQSAKNISIPKKAQDESRIRFDPGKHSLQFNLTDGSFTVACYLFDGHPELSDEIPPGTKVKILKDVAFKSKHLIFSKDSIDIMGGHVKQLVESWRLSKSLDRTYLVWGSSIGRMTNSNESGPPKWKEFSFNQNLNKIVPNMEDLKKHAMGIRKVQQDEEKKPESEFELQRIANITRLTEQLGDLQMSKTFGEGKQLIRKDVQEIMKEGFTEEVAENALAKFKTVKNALRCLQPKSYVEETQKPPPPKDTKSKKPNPKDLDKNDYSDDEYDPEYQKQKHTTTNTLFDFVKTAIPVNESAQNTATQRLNSESHQQYQQQQNYGRGSRGGDYGNYHQRNHYEGYSNDEEGSHQYYNNSRGFGGDGGGGGRSRGRGRGRGRGGRSRGDGRSSGSSFRGRSSWTRSRGS